MDKDILFKQYESVKSARGALFNYCAGMQWQHLAKPVMTFNNNTMLYLLAHTANTYLHWLQFFEKQEPVSYYDEKDIKRLTDIEQIYNDVDNITCGFLEKHKYNYLLKITKSPRNKEIQITSTPLQLFTHTTTHEFHHKGQLLTMSRLLGYIPADTDVIRF